MTTSGFPRITDLTIEGIPPFMDEIEFGFDPEVNVFIGTNGVGKSTILKLLADPFPPDCIPGYNAELVDVRVRSWPYSPNGTPDADAVPQIYLPPVRGVMPLPEEGVRIYQPFPSSWNEWGYLLDEYPYTHFDSRRVYQAFQKLFREDLSSVPTTSRGVTVAHIAHQCVQSICRELVRGTPQNITTQAQLEASDEQLPPDLLSQPLQHYAMGVNTVESETVPLYIGELSTGTQGLFLWILFLALKLGTHYGFEAGWAANAGVLFIDEIENHLHPTWQRRVIPALRKHFPGLQIFATTHSPFVVAGLKRGQVHRLYREDGIIKTPKLAEEEKEERIVSWTVEEILREFMEVDDPTDEDTAEAAAALRWLRERYPSAGSASDWVQERIRQLKGSAERTQDEDAALRWLEKQEAPRSNAAEWWEGAIEELRSVVSRDLESGGPFAAQRELFLEQLKKLLEEDESSSPGESEAV